MNILMINYSEVTSPGGVHKTIVELAENLSKRGHEVTVLQGNTMGLAHREDHGGFRIIRVKSRVADHLYGFGPEIYFYLKNHFKELNPDVVHVHGYHTLLSAEIINLIDKLDSGVPIIFSPHLDVVKATLAGKYLYPIYNLLCKPVFKKSWQVISFSEFERSAIINTLDMDPHKISIIPHGVDLIDLTQREKQDKIRLLYLGYLIDRKGLDFVLKSLKNLVYDLGIEDVVLTVVGEGPEAEKFLNLSRDLKLEGYVAWKHFLPREDLMEEIKNTDIFLLLSRSEAYGITVAEALALGTPCIVTKRTALTEFLNEPGCFGVEFPPDPEGVAELILQLHSDDVGVGPLTPKIQTWDEIVKEYEKEYTRLVSPNEFE